ncbi:hypothetical protein IFR05_008849 [Cadophora sp. M221]|nr:hypothetical protein IFR05_008849 [Cadophora sp. M221]
MPERRESVSVIILTAGVVFLLVVAFGQYMTSLLVATEYNDQYAPRIDYGKGKLIGIDLGRDYSRVGFFTQNEFIIIPDEQGRTAIPNYVFFPRYTGSRVVGFEAKEQAERNPENTFYDIRQIIGRNPSHPEVRRAMKELPYTILDGYDELVIREGIKNDYVGYLPAEFTGMILEELKAMAEKHLNATVRYAIITVPYEFDEQQRNATRNSAALAKLKVLRLMDEPTAIAFAYRLGTTYCDGMGEKIDCRYIIYEDDGRVPHLTLLESGKGGFGILGTISDDEEQKSSSSFWESLLGQISLKTPKRPTVGSSSNRTLKLVDRLLTISDKEKQDVDGFIVITRDPTLTSDVETLLESHFPGKKTIKPYDDFTPDQAIVCGASIQGFKIDAGDQGNMVDVVLLSLGVETSNGSFLRVIEQNTLSPTRKSVVVYKTVDDRGSILIPIYEGERELAFWNHHLGDITIDLGELSEEEKGEGEVKIELFFELSQEEILTVWVRARGKYFRGFVEPVMGKSWRWREIEGIMRKADEAREEDLRILREASVDVGERLEVNSKKVA